MSQNGSRSSLLARVQSTPVPRKREKGKGREFWGILFTIAIILSGALLYVWQHIQVIRKGYEVERLNAELASLMQEEKELSIKIAQLKSLPRIEEIARKRLRMMEPAPSQIVLVTPVAQSQPGKAQGR